MIASSTAQAAGPILWVDDDQGEIGKVDVSIGQVTLVGNAGVVLTDIAFDPHGNLFSVSFNTFYSINSNTGVASAIGFLGTGGTNALVFRTQARFTQRTSIPKTFIPKETPGRTKHTGSFHCIIEKSRTDSYLNFRKRAWNVRSQSRLAWILVLDWPRMSISARAA
jgi:hypothetical protein